MVIRIGLPFAALCLLSACSSSSSPSASSVVLPSFADVRSAPPAIQAAAAAVVRIGTAGEVATGSFISASGLLLTNNHVLGVDICPVEGCYATLTFGFQRGVSVPTPQTVFVVPVAVDVGLDMALVQAYTSPGGPALTTPGFLTLASRGASSLIGTHVHVVGHPEGHLKKWTQGEVVDSDGTWITFSAYALPGNSGSPVLDDQGNMVGILHRGPTAQDLVNAEGVSEYSIGTASAALLAAMGAPLPEEMRSVGTSTTSDDVAQHQAVYLNARTSSATVGGVPTAVLTTLGTACDAALAQTSFDSPDDMTVAFAPCYASELWIECRSDAGSAFPTCPSDADAWAARYQSMFNRWLALNGELDLSSVSFAPATLQASRAAGLLVGATTLMAGLQQAGAPLDFQVANYLAAFNVLSYGSQAIVKYDQGYASTPDYGLFGTNIASAAVWLFDNMALNRDDTIALLQSLWNDGNVDLGAKLYIEDVLYQSGVL
jgi:hypothetical protein